MVAVTVATGATRDDGDLATSGRTHRGSGPHHQPRRSRETVHPEGPVEAVADKGHLSNDTRTALGEAEVWTYISEPERGQRRWQDKPEAKQAVYGNRRRIGGERGKALLRRRGELLERSFAHAYETGGMRRVYLPGREIVWKRMLIHVGARKLSLVMRQLWGKSTLRCVPALGPFAALDGPPGALQPRKCVANSANVFKPAASRSNYAAIVTELGNHFCHGPLDKRYRSSRI